MRIIVECSDKIVKTIKGDTLLDFLVVCLLNNINVLTIFTSITIVKLVK